MRGVLKTPLARSPTRNVTGTSEEPDIPFVRDKMMALLKEATGAEHIFFLNAPLPEANAKPGIGTEDRLAPQIREVARKLGVKVAPVNFTRFEDFEPAFRTMAATPRSAAIFNTGMTWYKLRSNGVGVDQYIDAHRIPTMMPSPDWVQTDDGVMIAYGTSWIEAAERSSYFVDRILRGAKPSDLPFEQLPYRLGINLDAARRLGITVPPSVQLQADILVPPHPRLKWVDPVPGSVGTQR
jgi:ABC-type uncharacterized transport system substrate-binding protein